MKLGMEVGHIALHEDPAPLPKRSTTSPNFRTMCVVAKRLDAEQGMGRWVMGQMGHENQMGHMSHGSLGVDP